jgi:S-DNA-T family DNA segregation ATPase FtsK/SpoIIIE
MSKKKKTNILYDDSPKASAGKSKSGSSGKLSLGLKNLKGSINNPHKIRKIVGSFLLLFGIFYTLAFISYFFTWQLDQSYVLGKSFFSYIFNSDIVEVENWLGKLGAWISHYFIYRWFGISSIILSVISIALGIRLLLRISVFSLKKLLPFFFVAMPYFSVLFGFFGVKYQNLGGGFGFEINLWLKTTFGAFGAFLFILTLGFVLTVAFFNPEFQKIKLLIKVLRRKKSRYLDEDDQTVTNRLADEKIHKDQAAYEVDFTPSLREDDEEEIEFELIKKHPEDNFTPKEDNPLEPEFEIDGEFVGSNEDFDVEVAASEATIEPDKINDTLEEFGVYDPKLDLSSYRLPPIDLLNDYGSKQIQVDKAELESNKNRIVDTLRNYNIEIDKIKATVGPTVTLYEIVPAPGIRISKIKNLEDDIALSLAALGIRIIAPIPGKGTIGIEVPNSNPDMVSMRSLIASEKFQNADMDLPIVLGKSITNETLVYDLTKMPHLLVAGATGQGKSVGLNAIMVSLLYKKHPAQVKFVLVDPKKVELTLYNKIERHFLAKLPDESDAIITDTSKVVATLNSLCIEMDERYELLKEAQVRTIKEYNQKFINRRLNPEKGHRYMPYIVVLIDEFADLIMTAGKEVEHPIARLAQLARAIGIHLIVATQRPSVNVITGMIKANFPARMAFRVLSKIDSRTILDTSGADQLIGRGDMLISTGNDLVRLQCGFVDTAEVEAICEFIGEQRGYPTAYYLPEYVGETTEQPDIDMNDIDSMFVESARMVVIHQQGSASLLQRKLKLGFNRAGRIIDQLEVHGIIGPSKGSKAREVLIHDENQLEEILRSKKLL